MMTGDQISWTNALRHFLLQSCSDGSFVGAHKIFQPCPASHDACVLVKLAELPDKPPSCTSRSHAGSFPRNIQGRTMIPP
jgi:hypothetical protein